MRPHFAFYPSDWLADAGLQACSMAAQGLWIAMLALMHKNTTRGKLDMPKEFTHFAIAKVSPMNIICNDIQVNASKELAHFAIAKFGLHHKTQTSTAFLRRKIAEAVQLSKALHIDPSTVYDLIAELESHFVFSRDSDGAIYSRRMVRDERLRTIRANAGRKGGATKHMRLLLKQKHKAQSARRKSLADKVDTTFAIAKSQTETPEPKDESAKEVATFAIAKKEADSSSGHSVFSSLSSLPEFKLESGDKAQEEEKIQNNTGKKFVVPDDLIGLELYAADARLCKRWPELLPAWRQGFPAVDIMAEVRRAHGWEVANPVRRKKDRARFLNTWLGRVQDRGGSVAQRGNGMGHSTSASRLEAAGDKMQSILGGGENVNGSNLDARENPF